MFFIRLADSSNLQTNLLYTLNAKGLKKELDHQDFVIDYKISIVTGLFYCITDLQLS